jgi:hypothetical protein
MENFKKCKVEGCGGKLRAKGYCDKHYGQLIRNGKILKRTRFDKNEIIDCGDYYEICLYSGRGEQKEVARTKIDKEDLEKVKQYKWSLRKGYPTHINSKLPKGLSQFIIGKKEGYDIDHINHDILDNRKQNLRHCTVSQNMMNKKVKGYCWHKDNKKWMAYIKINKKFINLGSFINKQDAINTRRKAEQKYFGEFAYKYN